MGKYNYDKKALKGLTPFPFLGEVKIDVSLTLKADYKYCRFIKDRGDVKMVAI